MLPKQLKYGSRVESAASKSSRVNIVPNNGTGLILSAIRLYLIYQLVLI